MNALQFMKRELNISYTENGDIAYNSTGSACLDFFYLCGGMRNRAKFLCKFFVKAYAENPVIATKRTWKILSRNCKKSFVRNSRVRTLG